MSPLEWVTGPGAAWAAFLAGRWARLKGGCTGRAHVAAFWGRETSALGRTSQPFRGGLRPGVGPTCASKCAGLGCGTAALADFASGGCAVLQGRGLESWRWRVVAHGK